jgi:sulfate adenylyltransferase subunit 1
MVITTAPLEPQKAEFPGFSAELSAEVGRHPRRVSLSEASISGIGVSVVDLTGEWGSIEFDLSTSFLDYLGKGNRILFRLRDLSQLEAVALMAYEHTLSFEFDRTAEGVSILIFKRGTRPMSSLSGDGGTGI